VIARYRLLGGRICNPCYSWLRRHPAPCPLCAQTRVLAHLDAHGTAVCSPCAGQPGRFGCRTCGREENLQGSHCAPCRLDSRLRVLLDDGTGDVAEALRPLHSYLLSVGGSDLVLKWIRREPVPSTLRAMAAGTVALSHQTLDALPPSTKLRYFRRTLMSAGVLPEIDVLLHDLETYGTRLFTTLPAAHSALLGRFFRWRMLPLIRRTLRGRTMTSPMFSARRAQLRYIADFLRWLDTHGMTIETVDQPAIDRFVSADRVRQQIGPFVTWAVQEKIAPNVAVTTIRSQGMGSHLSDPDLAAIARRVFTDETIPLPTRLITLFAVVFAQPVEASIALTREQVVDGPGAMTMRFARTPIPVPDRLAALVRTQLRALNARPSRHPDTHGWLFPGTMPNQHVTAASIELVASRHGMTLRHFRSSRLQHFAQTVPASVLADVIGVTADTAYRRSIDAGGAWSDYPPLRDIGEGQHSLRKFHSPEPEFKR
jgi:hypothetical protein